MLVSIGYFLISTFGWAGACLTDTGTIQNIYARCVIKQRVAATIITWAHIMFTMVQF